MFDTVNMRLGRDHLPPDHTIRTLRYLYRVNEIIDSESGNNYFSGYLDTLKIFISPNYVSIKGGSLCKYYLGSNLMGLQRKDIQAAIEKISDELHLPFHQCQVTRMDIAHNMIMSEPHGMYFPLLGESPRYQRFEQRSGLYYDKPNLQKVFYNKLDQMKAGQEVIPGHYTNHNVLRYEVRCKKRLKNLFKKDQITGQDLYEEKFYIQCVDLWIREYQNIQKYNLSNPMMTPTGSTKEFIERMTLEGLKSFGVRNALSLINSWQKAGTITRKQSHDLRQKIEGIMRNDTEGENEYLKELDRKVMEVTQYYK